MNNTTQSPANIEWDNFCKANNVNPTLPDVSTFPEEDREYTLNHWKLCYIVKFHKKGEKIDYTNTSQEKWSPWPDVEVDKNHPAGFALSNAYYDYDLSGTTVGSRLCSLSRGVSKSIFESCKEMYIINQLT